MNDQQLVDLLKKQHANLKRILIEVKTVVEDNQPDFKLIEDLLGEFKLALVEHLKLENGVFYPRVFEKLASDNSQVDSAKEFMKSMVAIEAVVFAFFEKYLPNKIEKNFSDFTSNLNFLIKSLLVRVESEEDGIYMYLA